MAAQIIVNPGDIDLHTEVANDTAVPGVGKP